MVQAGVLEPLRSKRQSIQSSEEVVSMLIRIDDMMISKGVSDMSGPAL
jgi:chaperonin GroEL (HSP60 family)